MIDRATVGVRPGVEVGENDRRCECSRPGEQHRTVIRAGAADRALEELAGDPVGEADDAIRAC